MAFNRKKLRDLIEIYAGQGGVNRSRIPPKLLNEIINLKLGEFGRRTGTIASKNSFTTASGTQEYELPTDFVHMTKLNYDGSLAYKIHFEDVDILKDNLS